MRFNFSLRFSDQPTRDRVRGPLDRRPGHAEFNLHTNYMWAYLYMAHTPAHEKAAHLLYYHRLPGNVLQEGAE